MIETKGFLWYYKDGGLGFSFHLCTNGTHNSGRLIKEIEILKLREFNNFITYTKDYNIYKWSGMKDDMDANSKLLEELELVIKGVLLLS